MILEQREDKNANPQNRINHKACNHKMSEYVYKPLMTVMERKIQDVKKCMPPVYTKMVWDPGRARRQESQHTTRDHGQVINQRRGSYAIWDPGSPAKVKLPNRRERNQ